MIEKQNVLRTEEIEQSIQSGEQKEIGLITSDGLIISGSRRFTALFKQLKITDDNNKFGEFECAILFDLTFKDRAQINDWSSKAQRSRIKELDYPELNIMLDIRDFYQKNPRISKNEIKKRFNVKKGISPILKILEIVDDFLSMIGAPKYYNLVSKKEACFVLIYRIFQRVDKSIEDPENTKFILLNSWKEVGERNYNDGFKSFKKIILKFFRMSPNLEFLNKVINITEGINVFSDWDIWNEFKVQVERVYRKNFIDAENRFNEGKKKNDFDKSRKNFEKIFVEKVKKGEEIKTLVNKIHLDLTKLRQKRDPETHLNELSSNVGYLSDSVKSWKKENIRKLKQIFRVFEKIIKKIG